MAIRKVAVLGHPVLRQIAEPIPEDQITSPEIQQLIRDMVETMFEYDGRGLAAPQVHESIQLVVMLWDFDKTKEEFIQVLINPEIEVLTKETFTFGEGCLSLPGLQGAVARPKKIRVRAHNEKGDRIAFEAEGICATVVQHECDHLLGKLYIDRMTDMTRLGFTREYGAYLTVPGEAADEGEVETEDE